MKDYIALAACKGSSPARHFPEIRTRTHLMTRLLDRRDCVRLIWAPAGFGKTALALDYADTIFGFSHVFWFDATSPCFVRDVDNGDFAARILEEDGHAACVIIDGVPSLNELRLRALHQAAGELLAHDCEVLLTAASMSGRSFQVSRMRWRRLLVA